MINLLKGVIGGIGNIIPGLSGSALLVILGVYQKSIDAITEIVKFRNLKKNILFLIPIGIGIIIGTVLFGNVLLALLDKFPMQTSYAFVGFLIGTIPLLFKEANKNGFNYKFMIPLIITLFIGLSMVLLKEYQGTKVADLNFMEGNLLGFVLAGSTIIPGISGTVLLSMLGYYDYYLLAVSTVNIVALLPILLGLGLGALIFVFLISFLLKKYYGYTYYAVSGFCIATIPAVVRGSLGFDFNTLISLIIALFACLVTINIGKKSSEN
ncbi:MAG: DUF368 domain-containing protein [Bacilli bacterium]|nr:DUF368 domain-containing protein [Bacilli bacterium]